MTHIHDEEVRELRNTISELQGYFQADRTALLTKLREGVEELSRFDATCERRYLNFDEVLALLEKELT